MTQRKARIFDWPTRLFHWLFAGLFVVTFAITHWVDDESRTFTLHMLLGFIMAFAVALRGIWALVGSRTARFTSFSFRPKALLRYFADLLRPGAPVHGARNPASSWATITMGMLALGLGATGYLMTGGGCKETFEDLHELLSNAFLVTAIAHVAGVALHTFRHRDGTALSMLTGTKRAAEGEESIPRFHAGAGLVFLALIAGFIFQLNRGYDPAKRTLSLLGIELKLGESEKSDS